MTLSDGELERDISREVARIRNEVGDVPIRRRGQPCRVCADVDARRRVNSLLSIGVGPTEIVRTLEDLNAKRKKNQQITFWSVTRHKENHFNLQEPQKAALVRILEKEYQREHADALAEGVENFLTLRGYLKIMAHKGFETLLKDDTSVGFTTGLEALSQLEELEKSDRDVAERAAMRRDLGLIQQAIRDTLPEDQMRAISKRLNVLRGLADDDDDDEDTDEEALDVEVVDDDDDEYPEEVADFVMDRDDEDPLED